MLSLWEEETFYAPADVLIIGGGLLGLWCAYEIITQQSRTRITIIDKGITPTGASTRNAGFACFGSPSEMLADAERMGEDAMWRIVEMRYKGIEKIRKHFNDDTIAYDNCGGYECYLPASEVLDCVEEKLSWLNAGMQRITGNASAFEWCNDKLRQFGFAGFSALIENRMEGGLHSGKLVQALMQKVQAAGVNILHGLQANAWSRSNGFIQVDTPVATLQAKQLLICTNALSSHLTGMYTEPARGQVLVTEPIPDLKFCGTFHFDEGYYYFRNVGNRLLLGGARNKDFETEKTSVFETNNLIQQELESFIQKHLLPETPFNISHRWSGIMGFTENKLPAVSEIDDNVFAAISCNGMGVALSPIIAEQVTAMMCR